MWRELHGVTKKVEAISTMDWRLIRFDSGRCVSASSILDMERTTGSYPWTGDKTDIGSATAVLQRVTSVIRLNHCSIRKASLWSGV